MTNWKSQPWWLDSHNRVSGKPGAVQTWTEVNLKGKKHKDVIGKLKLGSEHDDSIDGVFKSITSGQRKVLRHLKEVEEIFKRIEQGTF